MSIPTRIQIEGLISRVKQGTSAVELVHVPHDRWPQTRIAHSTSPLRISVLDSSFNPPTRAHLALASLPPSPASSGISQDFDARLLLLSVRNADKGLKSTDASYAQRLEMMIRLANDVVPSAQDANESNVAVAIIDEPTFVGKARVLSSFLRHRLATLPATSDALPSTPGSRPTEDVELAFLVGMDTLERILATRYYPSQSDMRDYLKQFMTTSRLICSRRIMPGQLRDAQVQKEEDILVAARDYLDVQRLEIVDIGEEIESYSSSEVRKRVEEGDEQLWTKMVTPSVAEYITAEHLYAAAHAAAVDAK
ncbi:Nucleotidylyl transferase [Trametopsis cervina]|nr:Nucleotidylyl transferase [Trametopsis cervina]